MDDETQEIQVAEFVAPLDLEMLHVDGDRRIVFNHWAGELKFVAHGRKAGKEVLNHQQIGDVRPDLSRLS